MSSAVLNKVTAPSSVGNKLSQSWLFISENEKYQDIKEKLEKMFIPKSFCLAQDLRTHPHKYLVAVLAEGHLANFAGGLSHDVPSVASSVVILRDVENSMESSGDFSNRFDVVEISLPTKTRMSDFFNRLLVCFVLFLFLCLFLDCVFVLIPLVINHHHHIYLFLY